MRRKIIISISLTMTIFSALILYSGLIEPKMFEIKTLKITLKNLPQEIENSVFVFISDIHFRHFNKNEEKLLEILGQLNPDYLLIGGDLINWSTKNLEDFQKFVFLLSKIPKKESFLVLGNHEHRNRRLKMVVEILNNAKIRILKNEAVDLKGIYLIGVDDPHLGYDDIKKATKNIDLSLPKILLAHSPEIFRKIDFENVLVLTGHTHGGQVNLPFISYLILPLKYDKQYKSGLFGKNYKWLYVNRGIGWTFLPFRFFCQPEITIIKFESQNDRGI